MKGWIAKPLSTRRMAKRKRNHGVGGNLSQNSLTGTKEMIATGLHRECQTKTEMVREDSWVLFGELASISGQSREMELCLALANEARHLLSHPRQSYLPQSQEPNLLQIHLTPCPLSRSRAVSYPYDHQLPRPLISSEIRDTVQCVTFLRCSALQILLPA